MENTLVSDQDFNINSKMDAMETEIFSFIDNIMNVVEKEELTDEDF
jgi:hypothetical protein